MAPATYLFLTYLIPLLYGQLDAASAVTKTVTTTPPSKSYLAATPSVKMSQPSSSIETFSSLQSSPMHSGQVKSLISSSTGQLTTFSKPSQVVLNTIVDQRNNFSTSGVLPNPSINPSVTLKDSGMYSSSKPTMVQPSKQLTLQNSSSIISDFSQILTTTATPEVTNATIPQQKSSLIVKTASLSSVLVTKPVPTSTKSRLSVSVYSRSGLVSSSPVLEASSYNISSIPKVMPSLISSSPNRVLIPTVSKVKMNLTSSQSNVMLPSSSTAASLNVSSSPLIPSITSIPAGPSSSNVILNPTTSSKMKLNQTSSTTVVPSLSSLDVKVNLSSFSMVIPHLSSTQLRSNITSSPIIIVSPTSASNVMLTVTPFVLNSTSSHVVKSILSSVPLTSQSVRSTVFPTSTIPYNNSLFSVSSTAAIEPSCYNYNNSLTCISLQPSATIQVKSMSSGAALSSSLSNFQSRNASTSINNMSSAVSSVITSSVVPPNNSTKGSQDETHTPLIIGLAVGLSLAMVLVILVIVYYRRKRSSYQYNVFYDEQNIVMHPFDYSK